MPTMSAPLESTPAVAPVAPAVVVRLTGGLYLIEVDKPFIYTDERSADGRYTRPEDSRSGSLFFPLHCKVPLVVGQAVTATLRNDTRQKIWLAAGAFGKLVREGTDERGVSLGLGVIEELAPGAVGRVSGEVAIEIAINCAHYLPLRLVVSWVLL